MKRLEAALLAGLMFAMLVTIGADFEADCAALRGQVLRMHILAESDLPADQQNKLAVRDALLAQSGGLFAGADNVQQATALAEAHLAELQATAEQTLRQRGCTAPVQVTLAEADFATRVYEKGTLPAGRYRALQVTIGGGQGHNWWCVMYPPLCVPAAAAPTEAQRQVEQLDSRTGYRMGFALVELWEALAQKLQPTP